MGEKPFVRLHERMNAQIDVTSTDILESMELHATIRVPRHVLATVRVRLWCATKLIRLASIVGGFGIVISDGDADDAAS